MVALLRCLLAVLLVGQSVWAQEAPTEVLPVQVEWRIDPLRPYPGQAVDVELLLQVEPGFADEQLVPRFRQPLDLHLELSTGIDGDAWGGVEVSVASLKSVNSGPTTAINGERQHLTAVPGEAPRTLSYRTRWHFVEPGPQLLPAATARGRWASSWRTDFLGQRTPADTRSGQSASAPFSFDVQPFPQAGRPAHFIDALGRFEVDLGVDPEVVEVGAVITLRWTLRGDGNLEQLTPPDLSRLPGLYPLGITDRLVGRERVLRADLRLLDPELPELPAIPFATFDPQVERYVDLSTAPRTLEARGANTLEDPRALEAPTDSVARQGRYPRALLGVLLLLCGAAIGALVLRHPRARRSLAYARLKRQIRAGRTPRESVAEFFDTHLGWGPAAALDPRAEARLIKAGLAKSEARGWADWARAELDRSYGGAEVDVPDPLALALASQRQWMRATRRRSNGPPAEILPQAGGRN